MNSGTEAAVSESRSDASPLRAVWAIDPTEAELLPDEASLQFLHDFSGPSAHGIRPVTVTGLQDDADLLLPLEALEKCVAGFHEIEPGRAELVRSEATSRQGIISDLLTFAQARDSELIIVSSHGRAGIGRFVMGSFCEALLDLSALPVLFLTHPNSPGQSLAGETDRAVFATDLSEHSRRAFQAFLRLARGRIREIVLFHAVQLPIEALTVCSAASVPLYMPDEQLKEQREFARDQIQGWVREARQSGMTIRPHSVVRETGPLIGQEILHIAAKERAALITIASQRGPLERTLFGSVARDVFRSQAHPVLVWGPEACNKTLN